MSAREFSVCYSPNALPERRATEVDEQPERQIEQTEISENLLAVQRCNSLHGFEFDEKPPLDQQVGAKPFGQLKAIVADRYRLLPFDASTPYGPAGPPLRSEERRVGKEGVSTCRSRWSPTH